MEDQKIMISIIVPFYNAEKYLDSCIENILAQKNTNFELLLINDGSEDLSECICSKWLERDGRIKLFNLSHNGVSAARNYGIENSLGDYYCFVDVDDKISCDFCFQMLNSALKNKADLTFCRINWNGSKPKINENRLQEVINQKLWECFLIGAKNYQMGSVWRILYKSDVFHSIRFDEKLYIYEDLVYLLDCLSISKRQAICDKALYGYTVTDNYYSKFYRDNFLEECLYIGDCLESRLNKLGLKNYAKAELFKTYCLAVTGISQKAKDFRGETKKLKTKEIMARYNTKENVFQYKNLYPEVSRIKIYLVRHKLFSIYRFLNKIKSKK